MELLITGGRVFTGGGFEQKNILVSGGKISAITSGFPTGTAEAEVLSLNGQYVFPGFVDVHVHLREPGFSYKETIAGGTEAAARGGYTAVCPMPNLSPAPDCAENLRVELDAIARGAKVRVFPYGTLTRGERGEELSDMAEMLEAIAFSDDGKGVQSRDMMRRAMLEAKRCGKMVVAHCEDESLLHGGVVHAGKWAEETGFPGISSESEWKQVERDIELVRETGCRYHVCHVSTAETVALVRAAQAEGLDVSCETAPHYLLLCDEDMPLPPNHDDARFKMNPPLRSSRDRAALVEGVLDRTVGMIATDHAPHTPEEKSRGMLAAPMGIVGLECAFAALYTGLVLPGTLSLERLVELMTSAPARRFGIDGGELKEGARADLTVFDLGRRWTVDPAKFAGHGRATPFEGKELSGVCTLTVCGGEIVWREGCQL